jgi:hypothetical protein
MHKDNRLFDLINYIFKSSNKDVKDYIPPTYLVNRWVSMANPLFAKIINLTTNKWCVESYGFDIKKFYRIILPKYTARISYIKKEVKEKEIEEDTNIANIMECSHREILLFKETLAELNSVSK